MLPRAAGNSPVVIDPKVWNDLCDLVERPRITVADPLQVDRSATGTRISLKRYKNWIKPFQVVSTLGGGHARALIGRWKNHTDSSTDYNLLTDTDFTGAYQATVRNIDESTLGTHRMSAGLQHFAWFSETYDTDGYEVWDTVFHHVVRCLRFKEDTGEFQSTSVNVADCATDVPEGAWSTWHQAMVCPTPAANVTAPSMGDLAYAMAVIR